jgi:hypothetical protein
MIVLNRVTKDESTDSLIYMSLTENVCATGYRFDFNVLYYIFSSIVRNVLRLYGLNYAHFNQYNYWESG